MNLIYSINAIDDLTMFREFIAKHDPSAANRVARHLAARIMALCDFPRMGRRVMLAPNPDDIRDFSFGKYVVRYTVQGDAIIVLRIWHHLEQRA